ncbi:3-methylmercaptopropionyl-CoA dehydrogenase [BD1-7 clade bacterium]|uniref:3-methylmercaptopropionyl-CoA dehydrogenase n=1 Tax=BD1-7 clade bacterium TaxID=2029982 RepID=A0A5S9Q6T5_9GAMM|nr:3-methylmercaptopropionyl-CoA dehydrogenase [BD1-7 clade bacterium]CAA0114144.1 3-methylmercaptopropionyl-CoA dehydrogenase [BD1-7 clade bacterium]
MPAYKAPLKDMQFVLHDVFNAGEQWANNPLFEDCTTDLADTLLDESAKICENLIAPLNRPGDEQGVRLENGQVYTPDGFKDAFKTYAESGWVGLGGNSEYDGQGMPKMLTCLAEEMLHSCGASFCLYSILTSGAALALDAHGSEALKKTYLPKMYSGEWTGAMALTEAHAGTDLGMIRTKAEDNGDGSYKVTGTKIFITGGDHDLTDNIIHLVLAKLPDAPPGPKGISLFLVPKHKVNADGSIGEFNNVSCGSLEEKMGIHASATCVMNYDGAEGFLVGELNRGLNAMFTMMNYERLSVGIQGLGASQLSYQGAVEYAKDRVQSRAPGSKKVGAADPIIDHGDVRRMLMTVKALVEGGRAFSVYCGMQLDKAKAGDENAEKLVALLTPVCKAFMTDKGFDACVIGQQVLGGHGYIREWGMEQQVRDTRIAQIYEGTNGIQAMDLLGRKVVASRGALLTAYLAEINAYLETISDNVHLMPFTEGLKFAANTTEQVTKAIFGRLQDDPHLVGTAANDYLHMIGYLSFTYMWTKMAEVSISQTDDAFHDGKIKTGLFYVQRLLPQMSALATAIVQGSEATMALDVAQF